MSKEKLLQMQIALFFDEIENRPDKLMDKIDDALEGIFDQMPTILPIPPDAPPEVPNVIMNSSNGIYNCNIAKSRIDFSVNYASSSNSVSVDIESFIDKVRLFATVVFSYKNIVRFGLVGQYFFRNPDPLKKIQSKYLKTDLGELEELSIRYNKKFESHGIEVNDLIEVSKGAYMENGRTKQFGVFVQRDMNNVPVDSLKIEDVISLIISRQNNFKLSGIKGLVE